MVSAPSWETGLRPPSDFQHPAHLLRSVLKYSRLPALLNISGPNSPWKLRNIFQPTFHILEMLRFHLMNTPFHRLPLLVRFHLPPRYFQTFANPPRCAHVMGFGGGFHTGEGIHGETGRQDWSHPQKRARQSLFLLWQSDLPAGAAKRQTPASGETLCTLHTVSTPPGNR